MAQSLSYKFTQSDRQFEVHVTLEITYYSSLAVQDSSNSFVVSGHWSYSSSVNINVGNGGSQLIFRTTLVVPKSTSTQTRSFSASLSGINFWGGTITTSGSTTIAAVTAPSAPGTPSISSLGARTATAAWSAPSSNGGSSISNYNMQLARNNTFTSGLSSVSTGSGSVRSYGITGMTPGTQYYVRVRASNGYLWGAWSGVRGFVSAALAPDAPAAPTTSAVTSSAFTATVSAPNDNGADIVEYQFQRSSNSGFTSGLSSVTSSSRSGTLTGLARATTYYVRARARNSVGWGDWSSGRSVTTLAEPPTMANTSSVTTITRNSATITGGSLSDTGGEAPSNLRVQYNTSASTSGATVKERGSWAQITLTGLAPETKYYYRVAAYNSAGWSSYNAWQSFTTLADAPDDIASVAVSAITDTSMTFSWAAPNMNGATFTAYRWELSLTDSFAVLVTSGTTTSLSRPITGLVRGTRYYFRVRAEATPNNGGWGEASATTTGIQPNSGLRIYTFEGGVRRKLALYTFTGGQRRKLRVMYQHGGTMETE